MKRCRLKGRERFEILVGAAVLANNLMRITPTLLTNANQTAEEPQHKPSRENLHRRTERSVRLNAY